MEPIIILFWFLLVVAVPLLLLVAAFVGYRNKADPFMTVAGPIVGFVVHIIFIAISLWFMFVILYAGAHTEPPGQALNWLARLVVVGIEILYGLVALSFCSLIAGRKRLWPIPIKEY